MTILLLLFSFLIQGDAKTDEMTFEDAALIHDENEDAIAEFYNGYDGEMPEFVEAVQFWVESQPATYGGPLLDRIRDRRDRDTETPEEAEESENKKKRILDNWREKREKREESREERRKHRRENGLMAGFRKVMHFAGMALAVVVVVVVVLSVLKARGAVS